MPTDAVDPFKITEEELREALPELIKKQTGAGYRVVMLRIKDKYNVVFADKLTIFAEQTEVFTNYQDASIFFLCICERNERTMSQRELLLLVNGGEKGTDDS